MSLILDALQKADDDRRKQDDLAELGTTQGDEVMAAQLPAQSSRWNMNSIFFVSVSIAIFIILAIAVWLHLNARQSSVELRGSIDRVKNLSPAGDSTSQALAMNGVGANTDAIKKSVEDSAAGTQFESQNPRDEKILEQYRQVRAQQAATGSVKTNVDSAAENKNTDPIDALYKDKAQLIATSQNELTSTNSKADSTASSSNLLGDKWKDVEFELLPEKTESTQDDNSVIDELANESQVLQTEAPAPKTIAQEDTLAAYKSLPTIRELNESQKDNIPSLFYTQHQFDGDDGTYIIINKSLLRNGNTIVPGLVVEKILSDGFIGKSGSTRFKVKALSSWVNM